MKDHELFAKRCQSLVHCCVLLSNDCWVLLYLVQPWGKDGIWIRFNFILIDCRSKEIGKMKAGLGLWFIFNLSHCIPQEQEFFIYFFIYVIYYCITLSYIQDAVTYLVAVRYFSNLLLCKCQGFLSIFGLSCIYEDCFKKIYIGNFKVFFKTVCQVIYVFFISLL